MIVLPKWNNINYNDFNDLCIYSQIIEPNQSITFQSVLFHTFIFISKSDSDYSVIYTNLSNYKVILGSSDNLQVSINKYIITIKNPFSWTIRATGIGVYKK